MKKVNLENCLVNVEESTEALKNVNGGCVMTVGLCSRDGKFYTLADSKRLFYCANKSNHVNMAIAALKAELDEYGINGSTKYWSATATAAVGKKATLSNFSLYYIPRNGNSIRLV